MKRLTRAELDILLTLLQRHATLAEIQAFLGTQGLLSSSQTWDDVLADVRSLLGSPERPDALTGLDLLDFLRRYEEYDPQHVWLYFCPDAKVPGMVAEALASPRVATLPKVLDQPDPPGCLVLVDVRTQAEAGGDALILKFVETRTYRVGGEEVIRDGTAVVTYQLKRRRAVHLARLHPDGILELCVASKPKEDDLERLWKDLAPFLRREDFKQYSIMSAKANLWSVRGRLANGLKYYFAHLKDTEGGALTAAASTASLDEETTSPDAEDTPPVACLARNAGLEASVERFRTHDQAFFDEVYFRFPRKADRAKAPRDVYVRLLAELNHFTVSPCGRDDHDFAYETILALNQQQPQSAVSPWPPGQRAS